MPKARLEGAVYAGSMDDLDPFTGFADAKAIATILPTADVDVGPASSHLFEAVVDGLDNPMSALIALGAVTGAAAMCAHLTRSD